MAWVLILARVFAGLSYGRLFGLFPGSNNPAILVGCILTGVALYVVPLVIIASSRVAVQQITDHTISLKRTAVKFARACDRMNPPTG